MRLSTRRKVHIARLLSSLLRAQRTAFGRPDTIVCRRGGHRWELDLREGIDLHIFVFGTFEAEIVNIARQVVPIGGTILDIGANIGAHTLSFADIVGREGAVYAFEPTDYGFAKLSRNIGLNPELAARISAIQTVLLASDVQEKPNGLCSSWPLASDSNVHEIHCGELKPLTGAEGSTLDGLTERLGLTRVDLIKLDVDGNELFVLRGGEYTLRTRRPLIVMECAPDLYPEFGYRAADLWDYLGDHGYRCQRLPTRQKVEFTQLDEIAARNGSANVLLVPQ